MIIVAVTPGHSSLNWGSYMGQSSNPTDSGYQTNSVQGESILCFCIGSRTFNFAKWKYEKLNGKKSSFEALRRELQKN